MPRIAAASVIVSVRFAYWFVARILIVASYDVRRRAMSMSGAEKRLNPFQGAVRNEAQGGLTGIDGSGTGPSNEESNAMADINVDRWFERITFLVKERVEADVNRIDNRTITFANGQQSAILHARTSDVAGLRLARHSADELRHGMPLSSRVIRADASSYSIDALSVPHVAGAIATHLTELEWI